MFKIIFLLSKIDFHSSNQKINFKNYHISFTFTLSYYLSF
jgi:hypothetical protein